LYIVQALRIVLGVSVGGKLVVANTVAQLVTQFVHQSASCIVAVPVRANVFFKRKLEPAIIYFAIKEPVNFAPLYSVNDDF
jgi:hypothetical protein